jgi:hypothetical protein
LDSDPYLLPDSVLDERVFQVPSRWRAYIETAALGGRPGIVHPADRRAARIDATGRDEATKALDRPCDLIDAGM